MTRAKIRSAESTAYHLLILGLLALAIHNSFIQDDAYISFRYAHNLVHAQELTWNLEEVEKVEGYTNFLWTVMIAAAMASGVDPEAAAMFLGFAFGLGTLLLTYRFARLHFEAAAPALLTILFLGTNYTFSSYITGGLETQLQAFLFISISYLAVSIDKRGRDPSRWALAALSTAFGLALLTRMDSLIICAVFYVYTLPAVSRSAIGTRLTSMIFLTVPGAAVAGTWLAWKLWYYGDILPNTYYVKAAHLSLSAIIAGTSYVYGFFRSYWLLPFLFVFIIFHKRVVARRELRACLVLVILWLLYVAKVGGDFMEFRFFVPILPLIFLVVAKLSLAPADPRIRGVLISLVLIGAAHHAFTFKGLPGIESISQLHGHIVNPDESWKRVGYALADLFSRTETPITIATTAAGAIPYYSRLPTIDMLGPSDKWVARHGAVIGLRAGHRRVATLAYLLRRKVHLVIGHPQVRRRTSAPVSDLRRYAFEDLSLDLLPDTSRIIDIPLNSDYKISVLYLTRHDRVDRVIETGGLVSLAIPR